MQKDLKYFRILDEQLKFVKMTMMQRKDVNDALEMIEKQLTLTDVSSSLPNESELTAEEETRKEKFEHDLRWEENRGNDF